MFTYLGGKFHKCMKCSLHMYPTSPLHVPKREIIYLSVYWFKDSKTSLEGGKKVGFQEEVNKVALGLFYGSFFKLL